jgi:hypothetical protein
MRAEEHLEALGEWAKSGSFAQLVAAYPEHYKTGTVGTHFQHGPRPAVINEDGVLDPRHFANYMAKFQNWLLGNEQLDIGTFKLLQSTLAQMHDSISFEDAGIGALFAKGKEMSGHMMVYSKDMRLESLPIGTQLGWEK